MRHKLTTFILKNPPKSKKTKGSKKAVAGADSISGQPGGGVAEDGESDDELTKKIEAGAAEVMSEEQAAALIAAREKDDDWSIDTSKEAVAARVHSLDSKLQNSLILDDDDEEGGGPYETFGDWVRENKEDVSDAEVFKKAEEMGLAKKHKLLIVLVQAIFTEAIVSEIPAHLALFAKVRSSLFSSFAVVEGRGLSADPSFSRTQLTTSEKHQKSLLGGVERLVGETYPQVIGDVPKILMAFYQADILEEEVLTQWGTHVSKKVSLSPLLSLPPVLE
jgi:translation initiation factor 5